MSEIWTPHLTVAAVIERDGRFLLVEELSAGERVFNQPAGHVEDGEPLVDAVRREVLEETGRVFEPEGICGLYRWRSPQNDATYLRVAFFGGCSGPLPGAVLDHEIIRTHWLDQAGIAQRQPQLRSPLVQRCIDDYRLGRYHPLDLFDEL